MSGSGDLYDVLLDRLTDPYTRGRIRRALAMDLVLDTWLNGEREESFTAEAEEIISLAAEDLTRQAMEAGAVFPGDPMPEGYVRSVFQELLSSTAIYQAQKYKGVRDVGQIEASNADAILRRFIATEREGLTGAAGIYFAISAHEDLNAIHYYRRMKREDFLMGTLHRPWSNMMLTNQTSVYLRMGLVKTTFTGEGEMLELTTRGEEMLGILRGILEEAGEFEWRSNAQRWVIFGETDYDRVFHTVLPDLELVTREYVRDLSIPPGARVLEIGAGTGRVTFDLGLAERVAAAGGTLVALEPSAALLHALKRKRLHHSAHHVEIIQGVAETLPFPDDHFDLVIAVAVLHFTELGKAVAEMTRVAKPTGLITAAMGSFDVFAIPMVAQWFHPLKMLAEEIGITPGEKQGLPPGVIEAAFRDAGLERATTRISGSRMYAGDSQAFLNFVLKGAAFYQNVLSRLPFQERWRLLKLLETTGREIAVTSTREEQERVFPGEFIYGWKPVRNRQILGAASLMK